MSVTTLYTTLPSPELARELACRLLDEHLIACANIFPGVTSVYRWQGRVEESGEVALLLKTRSELVSAVEIRVRELHPYDCPCIVAWGSCGGSKLFLDWVRAETRGPEGSGDDWEGLDMRE